MKMKGKKVIAMGLVCLVLACFSNPLYALDADDLEECVGYYIFASSHVTGSFEGADYDELVKLDNGMIFQFNEYNYSYSYRPTVIILVYPYSESIFLYKLIIDDDIYDVDRVK